MRHMCAPVRASNSTGPPDSRVKQVPLALRSLEDPEPTPAGQVASDNLRVGGVVAFTALLALSTELNKEWIASHQELSMGVVFVLGYAGIIVEDFLGLSKAGVALMMGAALWGLRFTEGPMVDAEMGESLSEVSQVIFFLLGAMTVVEVVDAHQGFRLITGSLKPRSQSELLILIALVTFFMSAVLDNLSTTIVMVSLLQKLCPDPEQRKLLGAVVVVAANAGGAWTPIGDVTTTMLWIHGHISPLPTMQSLLLPSLVSVAVPVAAWAAEANTSATASGPSAPNSQPSASSSAAGALSASSPSSPSSSSSSPTLPSPSPAASTSTAAVASEGDPVQRQQDLDGIPPRGTLVLSMGLGTLLFVPVMRAWAGLPPYLGMLAGLGFLWLLTDAIHLGEERRQLTVSQALKRIDSEGVLFFTGVLLAVAALDKAANAVTNLNLHRPTFERNTTLSLLGGAVLSQNCGLVWKQISCRLAHGAFIQDIVATLIGLFSAIVDNVPLVAATMAMYDLNAYPMDSQLWQLIAYCAGTGGSLLIIGSAAGVAYMGMQEVKFGWYLKRITPWATVGYFAGIATYLVLVNLPS